MQQTNIALTPKNQGTAGHIASGLGEVVGQATTGALLGGYGAAATVGLGSRASEHTRLTQQLGVDQDTADTVSNITGVSMAALTAVPMSNVFKSAIKDYVVTVGGTTIAGQAMTYVQGNILENKDYQKQGKMYKEMATDPTMIALNLGIGSAFWALGRARQDPSVSQDQLKQIEAEAQATIDDAIKDADLNSSPTELKTMSYTLQHEANINTTID
ncbi:hypothetical protein [Acinetobacter bereziniae]|uniref:hypothetical protein n=1 Tax=Acinetobacter bereziniae TaxID=106648 RepID=UPI0018FF1854|nr:hypothetical protein [Acinetobacter bereziniae]MBJ8445895.1 hypothetical protein [Acinetobacter bereziniae]